MASSPMLKAPASVSFVQPLIARGTELRNAEPIMAYLCFYRAAQQVLDGKLHTTDAEVSDFATNLLTELEDMRSTPGLQNADAKSIIDSDTASLAYVQNFATNVFTKVQAAVDQLSVTKATGVGFIAASTFLALEQTWGPLSPETADRIKYAKYQAARILGAVKRGEDPNEQFRLEAEQAQLAETVEEEAADETQAALGESNNFADDKGAKRVSQQGVINDDAEAGAFTEPSESTETTEPTERNTEEDTEDVEGSELSLPVAPHDDPSNDLELPGPPREDLDKDLTLPGAPNDQPEGNVSPPILPPKHQQASSRKDLPAKKSTEPTVKPISQAAPVPGKQRLNPAEIVELTKTTASAQKHAKYAISALNYDDIKTAIGELETALSALKLYDSKNG